MATTEIASNVVSPCNKVCTVDPISGLCVGCGRSLKEIEGWLRFSDHERRRIMGELPQRLAALRCPVPGNNA
ncbi:MAG: DUF1289 domain-containing protein [Xanthobacteraceae bacterium]